MTAESQAFRPHLEADLEELLEAVRDAASQVAPKESVEGDQLQWGQWANWASWTKGA